MKILLTLFVLFFSSIFFINFPAIANNDGEWLMNEKETISNASKVGMEGSAENFIVPMFKEVMGTLLIKGQEVVQTDSTKCNIQEETLICPDSEPSKIKFDGSNMYIEFPGAGFSFVWERSNIVNAETLKIGIDPTYPPWTYENEAFVPGLTEMSCDATKSDYLTQAPECKKKDMFLGAEIDFAKNLCIRIEYECKFIVQNFDEMIPALKRNEFDIIIAAMSIKPERQKEIDFSIPYFAPTGGGYVGVGIRKNENDLKSKIDTAISEAINEGIIKKISMKYFNEDYTPK